MTPGTYIQLRRRAAGLTLADVAAMIGHPVTTAIVLSMIEADEEPIDLVADRLKGAFAFDPYLLAQIDAGLPLPPICTACGCSDLDPCTDETFGPCSWTTAERDICSHCARKQKTPAA